MPLVLEKLLPGLNYRIDDTGDLERFVNDILQPTLDLLWAEGQRWITEQNVDEASEQTLDAMLFDLGNPFPSALSQPINRKRLLVRTLFEVYKRKGTEPALVDVLLALAGIDVVAIISPPTADAWDLGVDVLADTQADPVPPTLTDVAILGESSEFLRYSFQIEVDVALTPEQREIGLEIVKALKPAHTHFLGFVEPAGPAAVIEHWELDISYLHDAGEPLLGDEADLHD